MRPDRFLLSDRHKVRLYATWPSFGFFVYIIRDVDCNCVCSKIYNKRDIFDFDLVIFRFWIGTFPIVPLMQCIFHNLLGLLSVKSVECSQ